LEGRVSENLLGIAAWQDQVWNANGCIDGVCPVFQVFAMCSRPLRVRREWRKKDMTAKVGLYDGSSKTPTVLLRGEQCEGSDGSRYIKGECDKET